MLYKVGTIFKSKDISHDDTYEITSIHENEYLYSLKGVRFKRNMSEKTCSTLYIHSESGIKYLVDLKKWEIIFKPKSKCTECFKL